MQQQMIFIYPACRILPQQQQQQQQQQSTATTHLTQTVMNQ